MAKFDISYDSVNHSLEVKKDGKTLKNVRACCVYNYPNYKDEDEAHIEITSVDESGVEDGVYVRQVITASQIKTEKFNLFDNLNEEELSKNLSKYLGVE